jgi:hypothetical protein
MPLSQALFLKKCVDSGGNATWEKTFGWAMD